MSGGRVLLDEHVGRVFQRVLRERGYDVIQAKDKFGERTTDEELLRWCATEDIPLLSNNAKDFRELHARINHAGLLLYNDQSLPDDDPEGLARTVEEVLAQYSPEELAGALVYLDAWYERFHERK